MPSLPQTKVEELLNGPGLAPPIGVIPNFKDPSGQEGVIIAANVICLAIATLSLFIRMYTKIFLVKRYGWEDYTACLGWVGLITFAAITFTMSQYLGVHQWNVQGKDLISVVKQEQILSIIYIPTIFAVKLSLFLLYRAIFVPGPKSLPDRIFQGVIVINLFFYIANLPLEIWPCTPRSKYWAPWKSGTCIDNEKVYISGGSINVVSDFIILAVPIYEVWRLQMSFRRKLGISAIFATGLFACISSIMHLITSIQFFKAKDKTYHFGLILWCEAEIASGIICSNLISMPQFFRHFAPKLIHTLSFSSVSTPRRRSYKQSFIPERAPVPQRGGSDHDSQANRKGIGDTYLELSENQNNRWNMDLQPELRHPLEDGKPYSRHNEWTDSLGVHGVPDSVTSYRGREEGYPRAGSPHLMHTTHG